MKNGKKNNIKNNKYTIDDILEIYNLSKYEKNSKGLDKNFFDQIKNYDKVEKSKRLKKFGLDIDNHKPIVYNITYKKMLPKPEDYSSKYFLYFNFTLIVIIILLTIILFFILYLFNKILNNKIINKSNKKNLSIKTTKSTYNTKLKNKNNNPSLIDESKNSNTSYFSENFNNKWKDRNLRKYSDHNSNSSKNKKIKNEDSKFLKNIINDHKTKNELLEDSIINFENEKFNNCFNNIEIIGNGSFGLVYRASHYLDGKIYAIKKIEFSIKKNHQVKNSKIFREVLTMSNLHNKNIVRFYTCWLEKDSFTEKNDTNNDMSLNNTYNIIFEGDQTILSKKEDIKDSDEYENICLFIQMEYCSALSLNKYLNNDKIIEQTDFFIIFKQILNGVKYIHKKGIIHRDLKYTN